MSVMITTFSVMANDSEFPKIRQFTAADGLSENTVRNIFSSSDGYLWLSTPNGLNRFDGYTFRPFGNHRNDLHVKQISETADGLLWIETSSDIYACLNPATGEFLDYSGQQSGPVYNRLHQSASDEIWLWHSDRGALRVSHRNSGEFISKVFDTALTNHGKVKITGMTEDPKGNLWFSTTDGIRIVSGDSVRMISPGIPLAAISADGNLIHAVGKDGKIYRVNPDSYSATVVTSLDGTVDSDLNIFAGSTTLYISSTAGVVEFNPVEETLKPIPSLPAGARFFTDNKGNGWLGDRNGHVIRIDRASGSLTTFSVMSPERLKEVGYERYSTFEDARGNIWIATYGNGLLLFNPNGALIAHYSRSSADAESFPSDYILCIAGDNNGGVWAGTEHAGVLQLRYPELNFRYIYPAGKPTRDRSNSFRMIAQTAGGDILAANRHGELYRLDRGLNPKGSPTGFGKNVMTAASDSHGDTWLGLRGDGISLLGNKTNPQRLPRQGFDIFHLLKDRKGRMWMAMFGKGLGVAIPDGDSTGFRTFGNSGNGTTYWRNLAEDANGFIWGATSRGLMIFHSDSLLLSGEKAIHHLDATNGIPGNELRQIHAARDGKIWIVMLGDGLAVSNGPFDGTLPQFTIITAADGLTNNLVQAVTEDLAGNIWVSTEHGLSRIDATDGLIDSFFPGHESGNNIFLESSSCRLDDGRLLFGTDYGILAINPSLPTIKNVTDTVAVTDYTLNESNDLLASFSTFGYDMDATTYFCHYLEGFDKEWSAPTTDNTILYRSLPPGNYTLKVKARNQGAQWSREFTVANIKVTRGGSFPWIPAGIAIIILIGIGYTIYYIRSRNKTSQSIATTPVTPVTSDASEPADSGVPAMTDVTSTPADKPENDDAFSSLLDAITEAHIADADYSIDDFASDMHLSRTALYNMMKARKSMAPMEYLRTLRLERAAGLLKLGTYNVSEVSAMVGMRDPLYFSRSFKSRYGLSPTAYVKSMRTGSDSTTHRN